MHKKMMKLKMPVDLCNCDSGSESASEVCITVTSISASQSAASDKPKKRRPRSDTGHKHLKLSNERKRRSDTGGKHDKLSDQPRSDTGSKHKRRKIQASKPTAAQTYGEKYQSELRFLTCACCAFEGPRSGFKSLSSLKERGCLNWHGHSKRTIVQTLMGSSFQYDRHYGMALHTGLDEYGMLPGLKVSKILEHN